MTNPTSALVGAAAERARFRRTLVKVLAMQVASLLVLWWLQVTYGR